MQLFLNIQLRDDATFANFTAANNTVLVAQLQQVLSQQNDDHFFYLWGGTGVGKSHLLQACCHQAANSDYQIAYIPLRLANTLAPEMCEGLEHCQLICIDDIESIAGQIEWEHALFHLYNRIREKQHLLIVTSEQSPTQSAIQLADLRSRLAWGLVYQLHALNEEQKQQALINRARQRGLIITEDVSAFLLKRCSRDMTNLLAILDQLDKASLQQQRAITIPFVKNVLEI